MLMLIGRTSRTAKYVRSFFVICKTDSACSVCECRWCSVGTIALACPGKELSSADDALLTTVRSYIHVLFQLTQKGGSGSFWGEGFIWEETVNQADQWAAQCDLQNVQPGQLPRLTFCLQLDFIVLRKTNCNSESQVQKLEILPSRRRVGTRILPMRQAQKESRQVEPSLWCIRNKKS